MSKFKTMAIVVSACSVGAVLGVCLTNYVCPNHYSSIGHAVASSVHHITVFSIAYYIGRYIDVKLA